MKKTLFTLSLISFMVVSCKSKTEAPKVEPTAQTAQETSPATASQGQGYLKGEILFAGQVPQAPKNKALSFSECQADSDKENFLPVRVSQGKLMNVFVYVKNISGSFSVPTTPVVLDQKQCQYVPRVVGIQVGQNLDILNSDASLHNVHSKAKDNAPFNVGMPKKDMKITKTFTVPEIMVPVKCDVHGWMQAYVGVLTHPFYAVSSKEGLFEIKDIPAGKYTLEAWHETLGTKTQEIEIKVGEVAQVKFNY